MLTSETRSNMGGDCHGEDSAEADDTKLDSRVERTSIASLPTEILLLVFHFVWLDSKSQGETPPLGDFDPALFPFAIAHVCRHWLDLLSSESEYWDKIVIRLDSPLFSPLVIDKYLSRSKCDAFIVSYDRNVQGAMLPIEEEQRRIDLAMGYIAPRLDECTRLVIVITYRSSIVRAMRGIAGRALPSLEELTLNSIITDTTEDLPFIPIKPVKEELDFFQIYADPKSIINIASFIDDETVEHMQENVFVVCVIQHYLPLDGSGIRPSQLIFALERLQGMPLGHRALHVQHVAFEEEEEPLDWALYGVLNIETLVLENIGSAFLKPVFDSLSYPLPERTCITRCGVPAGTPVSGQCLELGRIGSLGDVQAALREWDGTELKVTACEGFTDEIITAMLPNPNDDVLCPYIQKLKITKCSFSSRALVEMLKLRGRKSQDEDDEGIRCVEVKGGPMLEKEDREWLEGMKGHGLTYRWEP